MERTLSVPTPRRHRTGLAARIWAGLTVARQRRHLAVLDDHLLRDIGLDRADATREAYRPFWDVPRHWTR
jgi:uncharacterized protein YjiS (DUF1127 family)